MLIILIFRKAVQFVWTALRHKHTHPQTCFSGFVINFVAVNTFSRPEHHLCGYRNPSINKRKKKLTKTGACWKNFRVFPFCKKSIIIRMAIENKKNQHYHTSVCARRDVYTNTHTHIRACNNFYLPLLYVFIIFV